VHTPILCTPLSSASTLPWLAPDGHNTALTARPARVQVFNVLASMYLMFYRDGGSQTTRGWLAHATPLVINCLIGDTLLINLVIDSQAPNILIQRGIVAAQAKTQLAMNRAYLLDADIWLAFRLQLAAKVILLTLMFSSAMPALFGIVGSIMCRYAPAIVCSADAPAAKKS